MSNKPDWKDAPDCAKYLAQDSDGDWYWWTGKPKVINNFRYWMPDDVEQDIPAALAVERMEVLSWKETLEPRP